MKSEIQEGWKKYFWEWQGLDQGTKLGKFAGFLNFGTGTWLRMDGVGEKVV
jgi:hypothetical protein